MNRLQLGVRLESLKLPLRPALAFVSKLGVGGIRVDAVGDLGPNQLSETGRREFRHLLRSHNLELIALGCPLRRGLDVAEDQQPRIEHVRKVMSLAFDLGPRLVVIQAGKVPDEAEEKSGSTRPRLLLEALQALATHGDRSGSFLALETGLESGSTLAAYLKRFDSGALGVQFDPANLMLSGFDVTESLRAVRGLIRGIDARDARVVGASRSAHEVALGHGDVDWLNVLSVLEEIEYRGWLTVERESGEGEDRRRDIAGGVDFLRRIVR